MARLLPSSLKNWRSRTNKKVDRTSLPDEAKYSVRLTIIASLFLLKFYLAYGVRLLIGLYPGE